MIEHKKKSKNERPISLESSCAFLHAWVLAANVRHPSTILLGGFRIQNASLWQRLGFQMHKDSSLSSESFSLVSRKLEGRAIVKQSLHHPRSIPRTLDSMGGHPSAILSADGPCTGEKTTGDI